MIAGGKKGKREIRRGNQSAGPAIHEAAINTRPVTRNQKNKRGREQ
jgi:hypothetical protein